MSDTQVPSELTKLAIQAVQQKWQRLYEMELAQFLEVAAKNDAVNPAEGWRYDLTRNCWTRNGGPPDIPR